MKKSLMLLLTGTLLCVLFFCLFFGQAIFHLTTGEVTLCSAFGAGFVGVFLFLCYRLLDLPVFRRFLHGDDTYVYIDEFKTQDFPPNHPDHPDRQRLFGLIDTSGTWLNDRSFLHLSGFREGVAIAGRRIILGKNGEEKHHFAADARISLYHQFNEGMVPFCHYAERDQSWGFMNQAGEKILKPQFSHVRSFHEGLAAVEMGGKWGYVDKQGNWPIPPRFSGMHFPAHDFHHGLAAVFSGEAWGYINCRGEFVIAPVFSHAEDFREELAFVHLNGKHCYIDPTGKSVIDLGDCLGKRFSEGFARFRDHDRWGYLNRSGERVIEAQYRLARNFSDGVAAVQCLNLENQFITHAGRIALPGVFAEAKSFGDGLAPVRKELESWGFIDRTGGQVIPPQFEFAEPFSEGFALVSRD
jgi:hypothetical protein